MGMVFHDPNMTHWCKGDCSTGWACTIEDGACEGSSTCGECRAEQYASLMYQGENQQRFGETNW